MTLRQNACQTGVLAVRGTIRTPGTMLSFCCPPPAKEREAVPSNRRFALSVPKSRAAVEQPKHKHKHTALGPVRPIIRAIVALAPLYDVAVSTTARHAHGVSPRIMLDLVIILLITSLWPWMRAISPPRLAGAIARG